MKEEDVEVNGEINYSSEMCRANEELQDKVSKELKDFMIENKIVQIQVALVPKKIQVKKKPKEGLDGSRKAQGKTSC